MNRPIKYIVLLCFLIFSSSIYSQSCEDCATYNAALGCYAVAVCDDPNATNYCPADYYINSGSQFCEYASGCFCEDALNFGSTENCIYAQGCSDPLAANYTDCSNSTIISEQCLYSGCTCTLAFNYNSTADVDDGTCIVVNGGCADPEAVNYSGDECASSNFVAPDCQYENVSYDDLVWDYTNTGSNATIAFNNSVISFNGDEMPDGALLGVFFTDDSGDFACGGYQIIDNSEGNQAIAAWGSETGLDNGFAIGEEYTLFVQIYGQTFIADVVSWNTFPPFSNTYALNGFGQILSASFSGEIVGVPGCTDPTAANYNPEATLDDGSCYNLNWEYENTGGNATILINVPENITINGEAIPLCANIGVFFLNDSNQYTCGGFGEWTGQTTSIAAWGSETGMDNGFEIGEGYTWFLQIGDQSYPVDSNGATMNTTAPFSDTYSLNGFASLLSANFVGDLEELIYGCVDSAACNYDESANCNDGSCSYPETLYDCDGNCNNDSDGDLICDELEIEGCLDSNACNYNPEATDEGDCYFPPQYYDCTGTCINDANENGVCDELDDPGCTDSTACNYDADASADDGSCIFPVMWYWDSDGDGLGDDYFSMESCSQPGPEFVDNIDDPCPFDVENDADGDGVCESDEVLGCNDEIACNYNFLATEDDGSCTYPAESFLNCGGFCLNDIDGDQICDELEIPGCTTPSACNFDIEATDDDGSCYYVSIWYEDLDGDGLGDILYPAESCDQPDGFVLDNTDPCPIDPENDSDGDSVCESDEVFGCTDEIACNYNNDATEEDGSCTYIINNCDTCENGIVVNNDIDGDGVCDADEIAGCTDISYVEYNPEATDDDGSCLTISFIGCTDEIACNYNPQATVDCDNVWLEVYANNFESSPGSELDIESGSIQIMDYNNTNILGDFGNNSINLNISNLPEHSQIKVQFDLYIFGSMDGNGPNGPDFFELELDGSQIMQTTFSNDAPADAPTNQSYPGNYQSNNPSYTGSALNNLPALANSGQPFYQNSMYSIEQLIDHSNSSCIISFIGNGMQGLSDESWAIDNILISVYSEVSNICCEYSLINYLDCNGNCINDTDGDEICDELEIPGCTDATACNYDISATDDNGSCFYPSESYLDCEGNCLNDSDEDSVCDEIEILDCTDASACNYNDNPTADTDNSLCTYPEEIYLDCNGDCINDSDGDGVCDEIEVLGCVNPEACNYNNNPNTDSDENLCIYPEEAYLDCNGECLNDADGDGVCDEIEIEGCTDLLACNFEETNTEDDGSCVYPSENYLDCDENCVNDEDEDGVCDEIEVLGCTDFTACNYDLDSTQDDGSCEYPTETYLDCNGECLNDDNGDGFCDEIEVTGCTNATACNYNWYFIDNYTGDISVDSLDPEWDLYNFITNSNNDLCIFVENDELCDECDYINGVVIDYDADNDGVCDYNETEGCQDFEACNFNESATDDDGSCFYPEQFYLDCNGDCLNDTDGDGVCDEIEIYGCTDPDACNYNPDLGCTEDDNSCTYPSEDYLDCLGNCINDSDGDQVCDEVEATGCQDTQACNYDSLATDPGECFYLDMEISYITQNISVCAADNDGLIEITISGGTPEYTVTLDGNQETIQNGGVFIFENLGTGAYEVQIEDINGCLITETIYIDSPEPIDIDPNIINPLCFGDNNGSANPTISGGAPPYETSWSGTPNGQNLTAGFYDFTVSDAAGCVEVFTIPIINPPLLSASLSTTDVTCFGENDGQVEYTVSGGTPPYSFDWNGANPNSLGFGFYTVDITDSNGCSISQNFNVGSNSENAININPDLFEICEGDIATIEAPSGFENYLWSNGFEGNPLETDNPGFYSVTATDENGCEITSNFIFVEELPSPSLNDILGNTDVGIYETLVYYTQPNSESTFSWVIENNSGEILSGQGTNSIEVSWDVEGIAVIYVTETNSDGCENINSLSVEVNDYTSLNENDNDFIIFPNPTTQSSSININNESGESYNFSLLDINGKLVDSYSKISEKNFKISCENLAKGTYFAQITSNTKSIQKLIMIK